MTTELLTPGDMQLADELAVKSGVSFEQLIENAGRAVALEVARRFGARRTVVMCGPGNNGKDGMVAARYLARWGWPVKISNDVGDAELIIDALYGAGLNRDLEPHWVEPINSSGLPVVSIDVPSGLDGTSGKPRGSCVKADVTVTFFRKKPGHLLLPGRSLCGEVVVADIGIPTAVLAELKTTLWENTRPALPQPGESVHKYKKGHAIIISGPARHTGASRLAARATLKIGAGLVTIAGEDQALAVHECHVDAIMLARLPNALALSGFLSDPRKNAVCVGPAAGIGEKTRRYVRTALASPAAVVLDADALTSFEQNPAELFQMIAGNGSVVMTPHEGEFQRLFPQLPAQEFAKTDRARQAALMSGAVIVLKGADTVVASPDGRAVINANAPASLATAGSGDVLAGLVTGLLAQGMAAFEAACAAVWLHGDAANRHGAAGLTADTLVDFCAVTSL